MAAYSLREREFNAKTKEELPPNSHLLHLLHLLHQPIWLASQLDLRIGPYTQVSKCQQEDDEMDAEEGRRGLRIRELEEWMVFAFS